MSEIQFCPLAWLNFLHHTIKSHLVESFKAIGLFSLKLSGNFLWAKNIKLLLFYIQNFLLCLCAGNWLVLQRNIKEAGLEAELRAGETR